MRFLYESVAVKRFHTAILTGAAASAGTKPLEFSEKAEGLCAKSEYPGSNSPYPNRGNRFEIRKQRSKTNEQYA